MPSRADHYRAAEEGLRQAANAMQKEWEDDDAFDARLDRLVAVAQVHATLATVPEGGVANGVLKS